MSENMKLFLLGLVILYDTLYVIRCEWKLAQKNNKGGHRNNVYRNERKCKHNTR